MTDSRSYKPAILVELFRKRWDPKTGQLSDSIVTSEEIRVELEQYRKKLGLPQKSSNPPAFMKDFIRKRHIANRDWPKEILDAGFTARQVTGGGRNFEFVPMPEGQKIPFPTVAPEPAKSTPRHKITSVGLPLASRRLGRTDEPWLVQVSVRLHVVETYFALYSSIRSSIQQIDHLQNALKLRRTEIDALFLGIEELPSGLTNEFIISCEAKRVGEDIIPEQLLAQAKAVFSLSNVTQSFVIPIALKSVATSTIQIVEYQRVMKEEAAELESLTFINQALFELVPPVPGIGSKQAQIKIKSKVQ